MGTRMTTWLSEPLEGINYDFICGCYAFASVLCIILGGFHHFMDMGKGYFLIFAPFLPALLWSLRLRSKWLLKQQAVKEKTN